MTVPPDPSPVLRERAVAFCKEHCPPELEARLDREPRFPAELHRALAAEGLLAHALPRESGGGGGSLRELAVLAETLGAHSHAAVNLLFVHHACGALLAAAGTPEQHERWLEPLARGELRFAFALSEPEAGSDAGALTTRARRRGDGYVLHGTKLYTTGAADADWILTVARTRAEGPASTGTSLLLVPRDVRGLRVEPVPKIAGDAVASCRVEYEGVETGSDQRLGPEHGAWPLLARAGAVERLVVAAGALGAARAAFDEMRAHARSREQFGRPIGSFQALAHALVDVATEIEALRGLVERAGALADAGNLAAPELCMAKLYAAERVPEIVLRGLRVLGGRGYVATTPMTRRLRECLLVLYAGGTAEIQRDLVARALQLGRAA